jgi:hypothetical protein
MVLVRSGELACRTCWGIDCWSANLSALDVTLKIWGPFFPEDLQDDAMPVDLIDWLYRHANA